MLKNKECLKMDLKEITNLQQKLDYTLASSAREDEAYQSLYNKIQ